MTKRVGLVAALLAAFAAAMPVDAAPPQIGQFSPLALAPGKTTELVLRGQNLKAARRLWTTFAARCHFAPGAEGPAQQGEVLVCRVTVPRGEQVGIGALRLVTDEGVSNPVLVMLDDLPSLAEMPDNHTAEQAQPITWPIAVDGQCDAIREDLFRFHAAAGQRLSLEVVAQRLGSRLDPVLRIMAADGTRLAQLDDAAGAAGDCRVVHAFDAEGDYFLALRDVRHAGGSEYRYRLRVGTFPLVAAAYPAGGPSGAVMSFELVGREVGAEPVVNVALPEVADGPRLVSFGLPAGEHSGSGWFQVEVNPRSETLEQEPNDSLAEATPAQVPGVLNGRLDRRGDRDYFRFPAKKGERVHCLAKTRELGSPCDLYLSLHKSDGAQIAQARQQRETTLDAELPADGDYVLQVEDLLVGGKAGHVYRVEVSDTYSGFALTAEQTQYTAPQGGTFVVRVLAQRRGYDGPVELAVAGLGDDVTLDGNRLEGAETLLKITLPPDIPQGEIRFATIVGQAKVGEQTVTVRANEREPLLAMFPNAPCFPTELENTVAVGVGPPFPPFFDLSLASNQLYFPQLVGASAFDVNINRTNAAFKDPLTLAVEGLPNGVRADVAPVGDGLKAVRVSLHGPVDLAEQVVPVRIVGTGKFQEQTRTVVLHDLSLRVTRPLVVSVKMAGPLVVGGQQQAEVHLLRFGDEPQPVRLQVSDGPAGISAPIVVTVPSDANQIKIPLSADASATPGQFDNLVVVASTAVKGQNVTVHSSPAAIEIQPPSTE